MKIRNEDGGILPLTAGFIFVAILLLVATVDFGRYSVSREKLQTASDAASLAGAKSVDRMVTLEINVGDFVDCCPTKDGCSPCCRRCSPNVVTVTGKESDLLDNNGWKSYCCSCGCEGMRIVDRWVNYTNRGSDAVSAARSFFELNRPPEMEIANGGSASASIETTYLSETRRNSPLYPSVFVRTEAKISTLMMGIFNAIAPEMDASEMNMSTCSQGRTYYRDVNNGRWRHPPNSNCPE